MRVFAEPEHAGEGRDAQHLHRLAQIQRGLDLHQRGLPRCGFEFVSPRDAGTIQQRQHLHRGGTGLWGLKPEVREIRELLRLTADGIHRHTTGGNAVAQFRGHGAVVAGPHEDEELEAALQQRLRGHHAKARIAFRIRDLLRHLELAIIEESPVKQHRRRGTIPHGVKAHRLLKHPAGVEKLDAIHIAEIAEDRLLSLKADIAMAVVFQPFKKRIEFLRRSHMRLRRELRGHFFQAGVVLHVFQLHLGSRRDGEQRHQSNRRGKFHAGAASMQHAACQSTSGNCHPRFLTPAQ